MVQVMKIALLGDIAFFGKNTYDNIEDFKAGIAPIIDVLNDSDYVIGNLETPLTNSDNAKLGKSAHIKGSPEDVELLKMLGVTHVSLANNHMFDYGKAGLEDTIITLEDSGVKWYGAKGKVESIVTEFNNVTLRGYCCFSTNGMGMRKREQYIDVLDPIKMEADFKQDKDKASITIASCHWGQEHVHYPNYDHVQVMHKLIEGLGDGTLVIHGHHPHVLQGLERINSSLVAYSLGNFCFDDVYTRRSGNPLIKLSDDNMESAILVVEIRNNWIVGTSMLPFSFYDGEYKLDSNINEKIREWSDFIKNNQREYTIVRANQLNSYLTNRKSKRDLEWYIKRLNINSLLMIKETYQNKHYYNNAIRKYIGE